MLALALLATASRALADPTAADKETARRLMAEGRNHRKAGDPKGALQSFQAADAIMHVPTTGLEVARAEIELGQLVEARDVLLTVVRSPVEPREPRAFADARATAKALASETEGRIPSIRVQLQNVPTGAEAKVTVDGVAVPAAALAAPRAVNPGHHVVAATTGAAGDTPRETAVDVHEAETRDLVVDLAIAAPAPTETAEKTPAPPPASHGATSSLRIVSYAGFGLGGVGLIVGGVTGLLAISDLGSAKHSCVGNQCPPSAYPKLDTAGTMATLSTVGLVLAGVGVGVGAVTFVLGKPHPAEPLAAPEAPAPAAPPPAPSASLFVGPGSIGVRGTF